ncbi:MAG TPA: alpha amylase C-terminal domain-containing protein [Solirubrobacteraceae bacterium]|nr:alpha amylase C-terminal domain-containing protein [Solirubrobacteraceae bacterium]
MLAFRRWDADREYLVVGSLNNAAFDQPSYRIAHPSLADGTWTERLNGDAPAYGGSAVANPTPLQSASGAIDLVIPANGVVVLERAV